MHGCRKPGLPAGYLSETGQVASLSIEPNRWQQFEMLGEMHEIHFIEEAAVKSRISCNFSGMSETTWHGASPEIGAGE